MFDRFKKIIAGDEAESAAAAAEIIPAKGKPKRKGKGPDRFVLSEGSAVAIPDAIPGGDTFQGTEDIGGKAPVVPRVKAGGDSFRAQGPASTALPEIKAGGDTFVARNPAQIPDVRPAGRAPVVPVTLGLRDLMRAKPMQHFVLLADAIQTRENYGFHDIGGRFYEVIKDRFPASDRFTSITFWGFNFQGDHTVNMRILNLDDVVIAELANPYRFTLQRASDTHETRTAWQVLFPEPGTYHLVIETDGRPTAVAPIFVLRGT